MHNIWLRTVKFIAKKSKCAGLAQEIGFSAPNLCSLPWLVKGATQLCTSKKECNKLDLTAAQYFWLVDHNDWSRWLAISSPHVHAVTVLLVGLPQRKQLNLDILFYYQEWRTQHRWRCSNTSNLSLSVYFVTQLLCNLFYWSPSAKWSSRFCFLGLGWC